jgi:hypothetical protein
VSHVGGVVGGVMGSALAVADIDEWVSSVRLGGSGWDNLSAVLLMVVSNEMSKE